MLVERITLPSGFLAFGDVVEEAVHLRFKLWSFGIILVGGHATNIYCNNNSAVNNIALVQLKLNKNSSSVAYNDLRCAVLAKLTIMVWINTKYNLEYNFTKRLFNHVGGNIFGKWTY